MAKKPKDKPRKQKLKVFRTPIGFHDAYVAVPSQKAALEAWGADANIFAQGIAEQVTDPKLMEEPLARPGEVIKRLRGSHDEHVAALGKDARQPKAKVVEAPKPKSKPRPKPSRHEVDAAEEALGKAEKEQRKALGKIDDQIKKLQRERRDLQHKAERERNELADELERARSAYQRAMRAWTG
jgi:flagellar motility protein MotE (MotC chaperone)